MGKGGGGTNTTNTVTNSSPPPQVLAQYENLIGQSNQVAQTPYTTGGFNASNMLAGFSPDQTSAFNTVDQSQGIQNPYLAAGQADLNASQTPLWNGVQQYSPSTMAQYANPYLNQAVGSTEAQIQNTNAQQQNQVMGNAISAGAWGGDRSAIAQSELANQQALAENQTISGMENTGFNQQQGEFNTQQASQLGANEANAWLGSQGAALESGLGTTAQSTALNGAIAQENMGSLQQQQNQAGLNIPYEQFQAQQAYPFQTLQYNADISEGLGSSSGGTGTGSTTSPAPNEFSQDVGTAAGLGTLGYLGYLGYGALGLSDKRLKENIKKIGTMKGNNGFYPIYTYNFKGDNETRMGVIAQDVEKRNPDAVKEINGYKAVHYDKLARGGFIPHRASGGFTPQHFDLGGGTGGATPGYLPPSSFGDTVPSVGTVNINPQSMPHGAGPPNVKAPMPYAPPANNGLQSAMSGIGAITAAQRNAGLNGIVSNGASNNMFGTGMDQGMVDSSAVTSGTDLQGFMNGTGGAGSFGVPADAPSFAKGGFTPRHYDGGGGIGLPTAQQTGASPGAANVANQFQNMTVEQLQQLNARSMGRNPQIQMALQRKQMTGGAAQQPQQAGISPMAAQAQGAAPPAQAAAVPSGAQPENIMQQNGFARGGFTPQHLSGEDGVSSVLPIPDNSTPMPADLPSTAANTNMPPPANDNQGFMPQQATGTTGMAPLPSHDDFMKNYNSEVMNAAPYNKPDPILSLLSTMGAIGAGRSSKFGVNAGQGAVEGIQNWANQNKEAASESERRGTLQEQGESMYQKMVDARATLNQQNAELGERTTNDAAMRKLQQEQINNEAVKDRYVINRNPLTGQSDIFDRTNSSWITAPGGSSGAGQTIPVQDYANNIGVPLQPYKNKEDTKKSTDMISGAADNIGSATDGIMSLQRVKTLLPGIDQGKLAEAERVFQKAVGSGSTIDDARASAAETLPAGTPERAAYEELTKLEMNAALQNEVANGIKGRALGINMVNLGQKMFASPEMSKVAQENIIDKAINVSQMAKNSNEIIQPFNGYSVGTLTQAKQKYYDDSIKAGYAIPSKDYLSGDWKKSGYKPEGSQTYSPSGNNAAPAPVISLPPKEKLDTTTVYQTARGPAKWNGTTFVPVAAP